MSAAAVQTTETTGAVSAQSPSTTQAADDATPKIPPINVLLMGTDARPDESGPPRTDTLMVLTLDPQSKTAGMLSLPRDLWVPIPGYNTTTKINTAYALGQETNYQGGGAQLTMDTISSFIGRPVQYYVRVNFDGFRQAIDLIGGIDVVVAKTIHDEQYPTEDYGYETFHLDAGPQHLDGDTALKYARTRNVDDDYGRARRQQDVLRAALDKVRRADMLPTLLAKAPSLLYTMRSSVETNLPIGRILEIANFVNNNSLREIRQLVLDSRYGEETYSVDGAWILVPDRQQVRAALNTFFAPKTPITSAAQATGALKSDLTEVRIEVLNGAGEPGVAAKTRDLLQSHGWHVVSIGDADRSDYSQTVLVNYGVSNIVIKQLIDDLQIQPSLANIAGLAPSTPVDLRIVVGQDFLPNLR